ncbi:MAG TPA: 3-methyl-2-oxobutanoate hydroxymethyltransferase [Gemmatales bacterium]|nr:3-methyl-2-oxobutanoate hydroxymethyltransferase [Gemmatales bacterium]
MSSHASVPARKPFTVPDCLSWKAEGKRISVVTAYDFPTAQLLEEAGVPVLLVGDSLGMVVQGHRHSLTVTLEQMIYHSEMVSRGAPSTLVVTDMPFMSYQISPAQALENAGRLVQEGGAHAVKLEGGQRSAAAIRAVVEADIPVMGHIGLTPQSLHRMGGFRVQRDEEQLVQDAQAVAEAGAFSLVIEGVPAPLAARITRMLHIPTIGIGAGPHCDGQVLVFHDLLTFGLGKRPKFVKSFGNLNDVVRAGTAAFLAEVEAGTFPAAEHQYV